MAKPITHQQIIERIEWPLLDCIQEYHFFYRALGCDEHGDYRNGFARELSEKRGRMHQLHLHDLQFRPMHFEQELLFHAPRYGVLFQLLGPAEWKFGASGVFAGAITRAGTGRILDEEVFALIAIGHGANNESAQRVFNEANRLFAQNGTPLIEYLFLIAAGFETKNRDGIASFEQGLGELELEYSDHHVITEQFQFNQTNWGTAYQTVEGKRLQSDYCRVKRVCKSLIIRVPSA